MSKDQDNMTTGKVRPNPVNSAGYHEGRLWGTNTRFPLHRPKAGYVIGKETVAWARGRARDAPKNGLMRLACPSLSLPRPKAMT